MFDHEALPDFVMQSLGSTRLKPEEQESFPENFFTSPPKPAAVLMPLIQKDDGWHLLFIRRTEHEDDRHSGQVAFPGGHVDATDSTIHSAALREAHEEIGLPPDKVRLLGDLESYRTITNFEVTGVVGHVTEEFKLQPDPLEVDRIFSIPLQWLAHPDHLERRPRLLPGLEKKMDVLYYQRYDDELLWGITARLVHSFMTLFEKS